MGLLITGGVLVFIGLSIALLWDDRDYIDVRAYLCFIIVGVGVIMLLEGNSTNTYKSALDGNNPYHKEYVYRTLPDGEKVLTDSIYVKTEDND